MKAAIPAPLGHQAISTESFATVQRVPTQPSQAVSVLGMFRNNAYTEGCSVVVAGQSSTGLSVEVVRPLALS